MMMDHLRKTDPKLYKLIQAEIQRQRETLDLIPSENIASLAMLEVIGSPLTNKYSEGYPGKRYYPGNKYCDEIELLAQKRALQVFGLAEKEWGVNVQAYSGSPANLEIYSALLQPGDVLLGMSLSAGGHLTHGHKVSASGKLYRSVQYNVNSSTGLIDYDEVRYLARKHKPRMIVSGLTAYPRKIDFKRFWQIAQKAGAYHLADVSHIAGLVASGLHQAPFEYADAVMTTTHKTLRGPRGAVIFARKSISEAVDRAVFPGMQGGPHNNVTAAIALMFGEALKPAFRLYQKQILINARSLADYLMKLGAVLATGGTDNHLILMDSRGYGLDGMSAEEKLEKVGIIANRNSLPGDEKPFKPSGIRMGTPALTSRGMRTGEMKTVASLIHRILTGELESAEARKKVLALCLKFPLPYK